MRDEEKDITHLGYHTTEKPSLELFGKKFDSYNLVISGLSLFLAYNGWLWNNREYGRKIEVDVTVILFTISTLFTTFNSPSTVSITPVEDDKLQEAREYLALVLGIVMTYTVFSPTSPPPTLAILNLVLGSLYINHPKQPLEISRVRQSVTAFTKLGALFFLITLFHNIF